MRKWYIFLLPLLFAPIWAFAQEWVELNGVRFIPEPNVALRGKATWMELGREQAVLVQFKEIPNAKEIALWEAKGGKLLSYLGGNAYYAVLPSAKLENSKLRSVMPLKLEWKVAPELLVKDTSAKLLPEKVERERISLNFAPTVSTEQIKASIASIGTILSFSETFATCTAEVPKENIAKLAALPWVLTVAKAEQEQELLNYSGRVLGRASVLNIPTQLGGRGLKGEGIRIGIWDGNVVWHPDFGNRIHVQENESADAGAARHGTHVAGSVLGAGVLDPLGRGMAPRAEAYTWNFNINSNGLSMQEEMDISQYKYGITLTQNSYGRYIAQICSLYKELINQQSDYELDILTNEIPTLTHVFSAGNDQGACFTATEDAWGVINYGLSSRRAKNIINVGAVDEQGRMTSFSSWGPQDDGRVFPTICAKGQAVYSVQALGGYTRENGTSMACPTVTGHLALLQERYKQIHNGEEIRNDLLRAIVANTADDAGRQHVDFQFGYGIMNAEHAVVAIEKKWWYTDKISNGETAKPVKINVPVGTKSLRVMMAWNDPPAQKLYKYGESIMLNDLDLEVKVGNKIFLPWVLNTEKGKVEEVATRKPDRLNNMEQVTLDLSELNGVTEVEILVKGQRVVNGLQPYAVTYYLEEDKNPRIVWPNAGDVLEPGTLYRAILEGITGSFRVAFSSDAGQSYTDLISGTKTSTSEIFLLPADTPASSTAQLRLTDASGKTYTTPYFTLAPRVRGVVLESKSCDAKGWKLFWEKNDRIAKYTVLLRNEAEDTWDIVKEGIVETEFLIPEEIAKRYDRPILSVAATTDPGSYGIRSEAVQAKVSHPITAKQQLPFVETFIRTPSAFLKPVEVGNEIATFYRSVTFADDAPKGSNMFGCNLTSTNSKVQTDADYFDVGVNAEYMALFQICEIDLTNKPDMRLLIEGALIDASSDTPSTARFKLEDNGVVLPSQYDRPDNIQKNFVDYTKWYFRLKGGTKHTLKLTFAGSKAKDALAITRLAVEPFTTVLDLTLEEQERPEDKLRMGKEPYVVRLMNLSDVEAKNVEIRAYVNNELQASEKVESLAPQNQKDVVFMLNFATDFELGERKDIRCEIICKEDKNLDNNTLLSHVNNLGRVVVHEKTVKREVPIYGLVKKDPKLVYHLSKPIIYTDNGGALGPYLRGEISTMKFLPPDPSLRVRLTFTQFNTSKGEAILAIYTSDVPQHPELDISNTRIRSILTGDLDEEQISFVSEAKDGGITVHFLSANNADLGKGWIAKVDFVPATNALTLVSATAKGKGTDPEGEVPVVAHVRNNWDKPLTGVNLLVWDGEKYYLRLFDQTLQPGDNTITFPDKFTVPLTKSRVVSIYVEAAEDYDGSDNELPLVVGYDKYCIPGSIKDVTSCKLAGITVNNQVVSYLQPNVGRLMYMSKDLKPKPFAPFDIYLALGKVDASFSLEYEDAITDKSLGIWIDWNDNGEFEESEKLVAEIGENEYTKTLTINIPAGTKPGERRMRVIFSDKASVNKGTCNEASLAYGDMRDFFLNVMPGDDPTIGDIELVSVNAGISGHDLSNEQEVKLELRNLSKTPFTGKVTITLSLDGDVKGTQEIDCTSAPWAANGKKSITLTTKLDLSPAGTHKVKVEIDEKGAEATKANNVKELEIVSIQDGQAFRAIRFLGATHEAENPKNLEYISMKPLGKTLGRYEEVTRLVEMVVKMDKPANTFFMQSENLALRAVYGLEGQTGVKDGSLVFLVGSELLLFTKEPVLTPGVWQHIAVAVYNIESPDLGYQGRCDVDIYINGEKVEVQKTGVEVPNFNNLQICRRIDGQVALFRISQKLNTKIKEDMFRYNLDIASLEAEYRFNEGKDYQTVYSRQKGNKVYEAQLILADPNSVNATGENAVWQDIPLDKLFYRIRIANQQGDWTWDATQKRYVVKFPKELDPELLKTLNFEAVQTLWPNAKLQLDGADLTDFSTQTIDLSEGKEITLKASCNVFGHDIEETVKIVSEIDKSAHFKPEKLQLLKAKNAGLNQDINVDIYDLIYVDLDPTTGIPTDLSKVVFTFTLPTGAKATYRGQPLVSDETPVDLNKSALITITAENGVQHQYEIQLRIAQKIENWSPEALTYVYGDKLDATNNPLKATATSGLPINYITTDPKVVIALDGELHITGVGEAMLYPIQKGNEIYRKAEGVVKKVTVNKKAVTLTCTQKAYYSEPIDWEYTYDGLVAAADAYRMPSPWSMNAYMIKDADGKEFASDDLLPVGKYKLEVKKASYTTDKYNVSVKEGTLEVLPSKYYVPLVCTVKDEQGTTLSGVTIALNATHYTTDANGTLTLSFMKGEQLAWYVFKEGYAKENGSIKIGDAETNLDVVLKTTTLVVKYEVDATTPQGRVIGDLEQHLILGATTTMVRAIPQVGFVFDQWSDGKKDVLRVDADVKESMTLKAKFRPAVYKVRYILGEGGKWKSDPTLATQDVEGGKNAKPVEVGVADNNHYFIRWSDDKLDANREDMNIQGDIELVAEFGTYLTLPQTMDFEEGAFTKSWYPLAEGPKEGKFRIETRPQLTDNSQRVALDGYFAASTSFLLTEGRVKTSLYSTRYKVDVTSDNLEVAYTYYFPVRSLVNSPKALLEYTVDGTTWLQLKEIGRILYGTEPKKDVVTVENAKFAGKEWIQFRWTYDAENDYSFLLDNIAIYVKETSKQLTYTYVSEPAAAGSFTQRVKHPIFGIEQDKPVTAPVKFNVGDVPGVLTAKANDGWKFSYWKETGSSDPVVSFIYPAIEDKTYTAVFRSTSKALITYKAVYAEGGTFKVNGVPSTQQEVEIDKDALPVEAVANPGYMFVRWENGSTNPTRELKNVKKDMQLVATFVKREYKVNFYVTAEGLPIKNATVKLDKDIRKTDDKGVVTITLPQGTYSYEVFAKGYKQFMNNLEVKDQDLTVALDLKSNKLDRVVLLTLKVQNEDNYPVADAEVTLSTYATRKTSAAGLLTLQPAADKTYTLSIQHPLYDTQSEEIVVEKAPVNKTYTLVYKRYTVTFTAQEGGTLKAKIIDKPINTGDKVRIGSRLIVEVLPDAGWELATFVVNDNSKLDELVNGKRYRMTVSENVQIVATFKQKEVNAVEDSLFAGIVVAPNPFDAQLLIRAANSQVVGMTYELIDTKGTVVRSGILQSAETILETAALTPGLYHVRLHAHTGATHSIPVVKQ